MGQYSWIKMFLKLWEAGRKKRMDDNVKGEVIGNMGEKWISIFTPKRSLRYQSFKTLF
jgi:hypothetical protein